MTIVRRWTGCEARALRLAKRMSVRQFAEHLGVTTAAVSNWERRGAQVRLRYETQQILDVGLARSVGDVQERFEQWLITDASRSGESGIPDQADIGDRSNRRTGALLSATEPLRASPLRYMPPADAVATVAGFVASSSRVYVIKGPPGSGKTRLIYHLAEQVESVDFQLHTMDSRSGHSVDLATEILRYASIDCGGDPLLTLERACAPLARPIIVVIDGPKTEVEIRDLCRQLDIVLRQVLTKDLRFCLVLRTPPDIEFAPHPVLAASIMEPTTGPHGASMWLQPWTLNEARGVWDGSRTGDDLPFNSLPARVRHLARLPLYMHLLKSAGNSGPIGESTPYQLVDFCIRSITAAVGGDAETLLERLAVLAQYELPHLVPSQLGSPTGPIGEAIAWESTPGQPFLPLLRPAPSGSLTFDHDVIREYFLATRLAQLIEERGRSSASIAALNELAAQARRSANAWGVFEFVIQCLDSTAPNLLSAFLLSPTISIATTLPLILDMAGEDAASATDVVLRSGASRSLHANGLALVKALLRIPRLATALAEYHARWLVEVLRHFGSPVWPDVVAYADQHLPAAALRSLLEAADFEIAADAVFFARHSGVFFGDDPHLTGYLKALVEHHDWRVRAALADGMRSQAPPHAAVETVVEVLVRDRDYKVRAAIAEAMGHLGTATAGRYASTLVVDENWHVRERLIRGFTTGVTALDERICSILVTDETWRCCPAHVRAFMERLLLITGVHRKEHTDAYHRALFALLREIRTGFLRLPDDVRAQLIDQARESTHWLVRREVANLDGRIYGPLDIRGSKEFFRRLRDSRSVQIALDVRDIHQAAAVAQAAAAAGVQFIEVGDPLIKSAGVAAIEHIKQRIPDVAVVAEMMSADWGRDQVILAAEAGADIVLLIGAASTASVSAAAEASRRLGVPIVLDVYHGRVDQTWVHAMERIGVDGFAITTNIDLGVAGPHPLEQARLLRSWTKLPVAVSGGFDIADDVVNTDPSWDILVVGRSVTDAVDPAAAAKYLINHIKAPQPGSAT